MPPPMASALFIKINFKKNKICDIIYSKGGSIMLNGKRQLVYTCSSCGFKAYVRKPSRCPKCKSRRFNKRKERRVVTK